MKTDRKIQNVTEHAERSEKSIEAYLVRAARAAGMMCVKYSDSNLVGMPDRCILARGGRVVWCEVKSRGRRPSRAQVERFKQLASIGHPVYVIDCKEGADEVLAAAIEATTLTTEDEL